MLVALGALLSRARQDRLARALVLGTSGTIGLNAAAAVLNVATVFLLARVLGAGGFGAYASAYGWAFVLSFLAVLGLGPLVVRHVVSYHGSESWGLLRGLLRRSNQSVAVSSALTVAGAALVGWLVYAARRELLYPFWIALALIPLIAFASMRQAAMQGLGRVVLGRVPETIVAPLLFIALAAGGAAAFDDEFDASWAAATQVLATAAALALGMALLGRTLPKQVRASAPEYAAADWRRSGAPLVVANLVTAMNVHLGTILLAAIGEASDAGVFNVASRITAFISFVTLAATYPLMPLVARLYSAGDVAAIQKIVVRTARAILLFAAPTGLGLVLLGPSILGWFGAGFGDGATAIRILAVGEVVNVVTGFGAVVLLMTGHERDLARCVALGGVVNIGLSLILIPLVGVEGAAVGTATGLALANLLMTWFAWKRTRVWPAVVGSPAVGRPL